jgi:hypothetical protein
MRARNERRRARRAFSWGAVRALHCECDDPACDARIGEVSAAAYECVRAVSVQFLVVPDHENPETQAVVVEQRSFSVVALVARESRRVAQARDPRTPPRGIASAA